jgi:Na+/H+-dicarboxylate symporter
MQQVILVVLAMSASIGAPAIPSAGMVTLALVLSTLNLPVEYIALLLPIDRLLDTFRTTVNVEGDIVGALIVDKLAKR